MQTRGGRGANTNQQRWAGGWSSQLLLWEHQIKEQIMQTKEGPMGTPSAARESQFANQQQQDSTTLRRKLSIKMAASKRVLIPEGNYCARCVRIDDPFQNKKWRKFQLKLHFQIHAQHVAQAGTIVTKFVDCGRQCDEPEIGPDTWRGE